MRFLNWLPRQGLGWRRQQEAVESAVSREDDVADLHFVGKRLQVVPHLLRLAVEVNVPIYLLLTL